jgi:hypothetical protein
MTGDTGKIRPPTTAEKRQRRLEEQLRDNLHKRKAQARARRDGTEPGDAGDSLGDAAPPLPQGRRND